MMNVLGIFGVASGSSSRSIFHILFVSFLFLNQLADASDGPKVLSPEWWAEAKKNGLFYRDMDTWGVDEWYQKALARQLQLALYPELKQTMKFQLGELEFLHPIDPSYAGGVSAQNQFARQALVEKYLTANPAVRDLSGGIPGLNSDGGIAKGVMMPDGKVILYDSNGRLFSLARAIAATGGDRSSPFSMSVEVIDASSNPRLASLVRNMQAQRGGLGFDPLSGKIVKPEPPMLIQTGPGTYLPRNLSSLITSYYYFTSELREAKSNAALSAIAPPPASTNPLPPTNPTLTRMDSWAPAINNVTNTLNNGLTALGPASLATQLASEAFNQYSTNWLDASVKGGAATYLAFGAASIFYAPAAGAALTAGAMVAGTGAVAAVGYSAGTAAAEYVSVPIAGAAMNFYSYASGHDAYAASRFKPGEGGYCVCKRQKCVSGVLWGVGRCEDDGPSSRPSPDKASCDSQVGEKFDRPTDGEFKTSIYVSCSFVSGEIKCDAPATSMDPKSAAYIAWMLKCYAPAPSPF
jgi:hypothetical protein